MDQPRISKSTGLDTKYIIPSGIVEDNQRTYIYLLSDPTNGKPFYVGKCGCIISRVSQHLAARHHNPRMQVVLANLKQHLLFPKIEVLDVVYGDGNEIERYWINHYINLYPDLCNRVKNSQRKHKK